MLQLRVGGMWLRSIGAWSDLTVTYAWPRGLESITWNMMPGTRDPLLAGGTSVELYDGGQRIGVARMTESEADGEFAAKGLASEAEGVFALDGAGAASNTPDTAIDAAISRGAVSWTRPVSLSSVAWGTPGEPLTLVDLLDKAMAGLGKRWWVDDAGAVRASADPTTVSWYVPHAVAGHGLTLAEDEYYSHIIGSYLTGAGTFATVTVGDANAAARWGRREALCDLTPMGIITAPTATTELTNRLALSGARMGFAESLELGYGQVTTPGGAPVTLSMLANSAGTVVKLMGVSDRTRVTESPNTDIVIARSTYTDGSATVRLDPMGKASRDLAEVLRVA